MFLGSTLARASFCFFVICVCIYRSYIFYTSYMHFIYTLYTSYLHFIYILYTFHIHLVYILYTFHIHVVHILHTFGVTFSKLFGHVPGKFGGSKKLICWGCLGCVLASSLVSKKGSKNLKNMFSLGTKSSTQNDAESPPDYFPPVK